MFSFRHLIALPLAVFVGAAGAAGPLILQPAQLKALGIETAAAGEAGGARRGTLPATVRIPNEQLRIVSAPLAGLVEQLSVAPGDTVRRGQAIARLASPQALELQRDALQASAQATLQQQNLKRDELLFAEGLIAEARLQATRAAAAQAAAQAGERRQGLALAGAAPGRLGGALTLTAPIDGVVLAQEAELGQRVEAAAPIYRIARLVPLWLEVQAPLELAATLREGMPVKLADGPANGRLIAIGRAVDAASQSVLLRVEVRNGAESLRPGQVVAVEIAGTATGGAGPRIPAAALSRSDGAAMVFVQTAADAAGTQFVARPVRVLGQSGDGVIVEGLAADERIAVKGVSGLKAMLTGAGGE